MIALPHMSPATYDRMSSKVMELLSKYPQGITPKSTCEHTGWTRAQSSSILRRMRDDGILGVKETVNPVKGQYHRRFVVYFLAPPNYKPAKLGSPVTPPDLPKKHPSPQVLAGVLSAKQAPTPETVEREALVSRGKELLSAHPFLLAVAGPDPNVELIMLRIAIHTLEKS